MSPKKNRRSSPPLLPTKRQKTIQEYWLSTPTSNKYQILSNDEETVPAQVSDMTPKIPNPPPIFVHGVENIAPLKDFLKTHAEGKHTIKLIGNSQIRIQPTDSQTYTTLIRELKVKNTQFHSFQPKTERKFRAVLKGLHHSTNTDDIREELSTKGHIAVNISNMKNTITKAPFPMFLLELEQNINNKQIYEITNMLNSKIIIEPQRQKREIAQCQTCQRYGHTKSYCNRSPRCVKCAGDHLTKNCSKKDRTQDAKCVLCEGNHPANYKGCQIYKELQKRKSPQLRPKVPSPSNIPETKNQSSPQTDPKEPPITKPTYAQSIGSKYKKIEEINHINEQQHDNRQNTNNDRLENLMTKLMERMDMLLTLLTTVVSKMV